MLPIGKQITNFVRACETIHALLVDVSTVTADDRASSS